MAKTIRQLSVCDKLKDRIETERQRVVRIAEEYQSFAETFCGTRNWEEICEARRDCVELLTKVEGTCWGLLNAQKEMESLIDEINAKLNPQEEVGT